LFDQKTGKLQIRTASVFEPLLQPARYKGAWGGRGSGKSHFFAELVVDEHVSGRGLRTLCVREVLKSARSNPKPTEEPMAEATAILSPNHATQRILRHRSAVITLARMRAKKAVLLELRAQGLKQQHFSARAPAGLACAFYARSEILR